MKSKLEIILVLVVVLLTVLSLYNNEVSQKRQEKIEILNERIKEKEKINETNEMQIRMRDDALNLLTERIHDLEEELREAKSLSYRSSLKISSRGTSDESYLGTFTVTAYTNGFESTGKHPNDEGYGITKSGERTKEGRTCACPPEWEEKTIVFIEGVGERVCTDIGGAIKGKRLDVFFEDLDVALQFGKQKRKVWKVGVEE